jgi:hypothetical protein
MECHQNMTALDGEYIRHEKIWLKNTLEFKALSFMLLFCDTTEGLGKTAQVQADMFRQSKLH